MERKFGLYNGSNEPDFQRALFAQTGLYAEVHEHSPEGVGGACVRFYDNANVRAHSFYFTCKRDAVNALRLAAFATAGTANAAEPVFQVGEAIASTPPASIHIENVVVHYHNTGPAPAFDLTRFAEAIQANLCKGMAKGKPTP